MKITWGSTQVPYALVCSPSDISPPAYTAYQAYFYTYAPMSALHAAWQRRREVVYYLPIYQGAPPQKDLAAVVLVWAHSTELIRRFATGRVDLGRAKPGTLN